MRCFRWAIRASIRRFISRTYKAGEESNSKMAHADHGEYREELHHGEHPHSYDHTEPRYSIVWVIFIVTVVLTAGIGIVVQMYTDRTESNIVYDKVLSQESWQLRDLRNKEQWELTHYGYYDKNAGTVRMPIDQAMKLVIQEASEGRPKYPTAPYAVKTPEQLAQGTPAVSQPGAAAAQANQTQGVVSSPNVQRQSAEPQQPNK